MLAHVPVAGGNDTGYFGPLAYAYLQSGREDEFRRLVHEMKVLLDDQRADGIQNQFQSFARAQYAVLTGDTEAAIGHLQAAIDQGYAGVYWHEPIFDQIAADDRVRELGATALARANEERSKLGLEPYEPPLGLD